MGRIPYDHAIMCAEYGDIGVRTVNLCLWAYGPYTLYRAPVRTHSVQLLADFQHDEDGWDNGKPDRKYVSFHHVEVRELEQRRWHIVRAKARPVYFGRAHESRRRAQLRFVCRGGLRARVLCAFASLCQNRPFHEKSSVRS